MAYYEAGPTGYELHRLLISMRAGQLVAIRVPNRHEEAIRDLCRARADVVEDLAR